MKIKFLSFTIIEVVITLIITSIITSIIYFSLSHLQNGYVKYFNSSIKSNKISIFMKVFDNDFSDAFVANFTNGELELKYNGTDSIIIYRFDKSFILREKNNNIDSFPFENSLVTYTFVPETTLIDFVRIDYLYQNVIVSKHFKKKYCMVQLMSNNN